MMRVVRNLWGPVITAHISASPALYLYHTAQPAELAPADVCAGINVEVAHRHRQGAVGVILLEDVGLQLMHTLGWAHTLVLPENCMQTYLIMVCATKHVFSYARTRHASKYGMPARPQELAPQLAQPGTLPAISDHTSYKQERHCLPPVRAANS